MKRMLCIVSGMNAGGAETFLMKIYRNLDKTKYQMDFAVAISDQGFYDDEIKQYGGFIYNVTPKSKGVVKNFISIYRIVKNNNYQYVLRTAGHSISALELLAAKFAGAKVRVFRSSNTYPTSGRKRDVILHYLFAFLPRCVANVKLAPSTNAAEYMFGKKCIEKGKAHIIHNAVDLNVFRYSDHHRNSIRNEFGINDGDILLGHIGRFNQQKNHLYLIDVFNHFYKVYPNSYLMLVGAGEQEEAIYNRIRCCGLEGRVLFAGVRSDVAKLMSGFDVFVFPSLYEGMPNVIIEAQATGLPTIASDKITKEVKITDLVTFCSIDDNYSSWVSAIEQAVNYPRHDWSEVIKKAGYSIDASTNRFIELTFNSI